MKIINPLIATLIATAHISIWPSVANAQGNYIFDQQSAVEPNYGEVAASISTDAPAQSFTPQLDRIAFIRLYIYNGSPGITGSLFVNLRTGSPTGTVVAASEIVTLTPQSSGPTEFVFSSPAPVTPGSTYYFDPQIQSGSLAWGITGSRLFNYPAGTAFSHGTPISDVDLWFREGIVVPEPSAAALLIAGAFTVACLRHRNSR